MTDALLAIQQKRKEHLKRSRFRFWLPVLLMAAGISLLWSLVPYPLILKPPRARLSPQRPRGAAAAYVELEPAYAATVFKKIRSAWASDEQKGNLSLEMGLVDLEHALPDPWYLEKGSRYPGSWSPAPVEPLPQPPPPITAPSQPPPDDTFPKPAAGIRYALSFNLQQAGFTFTPPELPLPEASGTGTFEVETDETGRVIHLMLLTKRTPSLARLEQAIARGTAKSAAIGQITCGWQN